MRAPQTLHLAEKRFFRTSPMTSLSFGVQEKVCGSTTNRFWLLHPGADPFQEQIRPTAMLVALREKWRDWWGLTDTPTDILPEGSASCVQSFDDSLNFAIRMTYRISLRSSSMWEPRHPLLKVFQRHLILCRHCFSEEQQWPLEGLFINGGFHET